MTVRRVNKRAREERYHETEKDKDIFLERMLTNQPMVTWSFVLHTLLSCPIIKDSQCQSNYQHYFEVFYIKEYRGLLLKDIPRNYFLSSCTALQMSDNLGESNNCLPRTLRILALDISKFWLCFFFF